MNFQSWQGVDDPKFGYGSMLAGFVSGLPKTVSLSDNASVSVYMNTPNGKRGWLQDQFRVSFTMWETDVLPDYFVRWLDRYDQVLVPCDHNVELFSRYHQNVKKVPLGVDIKFWAGYKTPDGVFRFNAGGSLWERKGLDLVVKAFTKLALSDAELHIKIAPHARDTPQINHPQIVLHRGWMDSEQQRDWYKQGHVFISASRGEGFGLMPLQAIAMGIPTILSDSSGHKEFSYLATGVAPTTPKPSLLGGHWDETNIDDLCEIMLDHYRNWQTHRDEAVVNARGCTAFTWRKATKTLLDAIPIGDLLENPVWVNETVNVDIQVNRNLRCDIHRTHYEFAKGETYSVPEGVVQVLKDSGYLV